MRSIVSSSLPVGFDSLERFVPQWAKDTTQERLEVRCSLEMDEIREFYDAMTARAEEALAYLEQFPVDSMPDSGRRLLALVLALAQAHVAVEIHKAARAPNTPWPNSIRIKRGLPLLG